MEIDDLRKRNLVIFECVSGSKAYGLDTTESDTDIKGVFIAPKDTLFGFSEIEQVANDSNDIVFYEIKKFMSLVAKNNPNVLEMLYTPENCVVSEHPLFSKVRESNYLSKMCRNTFVRYAMGQIRKARGLNKKIVNPMPEKRLGVLDFCYVTSEKGSEPLRLWLVSKDFDQADCGLAGLQHFPNTYLLYHSKDHDLRGIVNGEDATDVRTSNIPKELKHSTYLHFNVDAFKSHCQNHKEYWEWVKKRNSVRYETNVSHGKNYDSKNMLHVFRLLHTAEDIAANSMIDFKSYDREFLLKIKSGKFEYDDLIAKAEKRTEELERLFDSSNLPDEPNYKHIERILIETRNKFYQQYESN